MQIASKIPGYGMSCATDLQHKITQLIGEETITKVIETGTYLGLGTTRAVLEGFKIHGFDADLVSIEANPTHYRQALNNNIGVSGLHLLNGYSIPKRMVPTSFTFDVPDHIVVDHEDKDLELMYRQEMSFNVEDDLLPRAIKALSGDPELVILDSAGAVGLIEFKYLTELLKENSYWLVLDDINHVKHYHSFELIKSMPEKFEIIWQSASEDLHRSAIIRVNGS